jgi:hypothetical protein
MEVQITSDEQIIGRNLILKDEDGKQSEISLLCPRDNEKFGLELLVVSDGTEYLNLHGSGTEKKGIINAEFALSLDESLNKSEGTLSSLENLLKIELEDYDISGLAKGEVSGTVTYSTESMAQLANYSLKVQGEGNMKKSTAKITVLAGKDTFATIDMTSTVSDKVESTKPTDSDTIYDAGNVSDMEKYQSEMDLPALIEDIQSKLGIDLSGLLYMGLL